MASTLARGEESAHGSAIILIGVASQVPADAGGGAARVAAALGDELGWPAGLAGGVARLEEGVRMLNCLLDSFHEILDDAKLLHTVDT